MARSAASSKKAEPPVAESGRDSQIVRTSSGEQIASHIRWLIFDGSLRPGMRVPQDTIARNLGVSRIPVREALIVLEREGWVTIEMHRCAFINAPMSSRCTTITSSSGSSTGSRRGGPWPAPRPACPIGWPGSSHNLASAADPDELRRLSIAFHAAIVEAAAAPA